MNFEQRVEDLITIIKKADNAFHIDDDPIMEDSEYDLLYRELKAIERQHPNLVRPDSPTQNVGGTADDERFKKVKHEIPMLSLENRYENDDIEAWYNSREKETNTNLKTHGEPKVDGLAISLIYLNGILVRGATRGRNGVGEDITKNALVIDDIPNQLSGNYPVKIEVRGEIFFLRSDMPRLSELIETQTGKPPKNVRNAASGSTRQKDPAVTKSRQPRFFPYSAYSDEFEQIGIESHSQSMEYLNEIGFSTTKYGRFTSLYSNSAEVIAGVTDFLESMKTMDMPCDGYVVKVDRFNIQEQLGLIAKTPRWAFAGKLSVSESSITTLRTADFQTSRHGTITPVANIDTVELEGTSVSRATLHNFDEINRLNIALGDKIVIKKGGGVIPDIVCVHEENPDPERTVIQPPSHCPSCGGEVVKMVDRVDYRCTNTLGCPAQRDEKIIHFASKDGMDIASFGSSTIKLLCEMGHLERPSEIFQLTKAHLSVLPGFGAKKCANVLAGIEKSKAVDFHRFLTAVGIPDVGIERARELANKFKTPEGLLNANPRDIREIKGFDELSFAIVSFFKNEQTREEFNTLINMLNIKEVESVEQSLVGKSFVVTGKFLSVKRSAIEAFLKKRGGKVGQPSGNTDYLILGIDGGTKSDKVDALNRKGANIQILDEDTAISLFGIT
tara:strand:+ start:18724 stop:20739 length:2016 start_codon:yes stop_codon:yes gene_type:complete